MRAGRSAIIVVASLRGEKQEEEEEEQPKSSPESRSSKTFSRFVCINRLCRSVFVCPSALISEDSASGFFFSISFLDDSTHPTPSSSRQKEDVVSFSRLNSAMSAAFLAVVLVSVELIAVESALRLQQQREAAL